MVGGHCTALAMLAWWLLWAFLPLVSPHVHDTSTELSLALARYREQTPAESCTHSERKDDRCQCVNGISMPGEMLSENKEAMFKLGYVRSCRVNITVRRPETEGGEWTIVSREHYVHERSNCAPPGNLFVVESQPRTHPDYSVSWMLQLPFKCESALNDPEERLEHRKTFVFNCGLTRVEETDDVNTLEHVDMMSLYLLRTLDWTYDRKRVMEYIDTFGKSNATGKSNWKYANMTRLMRNYTIRYETDGFFGSASVTEYILVVSITIVCCVAILVGSVWLTIHYRLEGCDARDKATDDTILERARHKIREERRRLFPDDEDEREEFVPAQSKKEKAQVATPVLDANEKKKS